PNKSLEALTYDTTYYKWNRDDSTLWTANEDALTLDGPTSSATNAALVRITAVPMHIKFFPLFTHWFYRLDAAQGGPIPGAGKDVPFNGLVGLAALGDGRLLVLERSCGLVQGEEGGLPSLITSSIYYVDTSRTKPSSPTPLKKTLLWRQGFPFSNYEGITLGPKLADGSRAVILVADGDVSKTRVGGMVVTLQWKKALFTLRLCEE
ncbi:MAG: esterase-like activity of phytase family protein, partial [Kiritimatiellae bacterium]|nr:esterase-like activity of phytase family protein [Kiritimatiellia bacterium]